MKIVFRTDSSLAIGTGHAIRCLTLADLLRSGGAEVSFVCRNLPGNVINSINRRGYRVHLLPYEGDAITHDPRRSEYERWLTVEQDRDAEQSLAILADTVRGTDWLVVDHYGLDASWQRPMRAQAGRIAVIDDIANRLHDCDLLLDQNLYANADERYRHLVPESCKTLLGPSYALLRPEFEMTRARTARQFKAVRTLLVFFGGADQTNETMKALRAIDLVGRPELRIEVIAGSVNPYREDIWDWCVTHPNAQLHENVSNMAELMLHADLAIGAGGTTTWERCCLGLPTLMIAIAENQRQISESAGHAGIARYLGTADTVTDEQIAAELAAVIDAPESLQAISERAMAAVDGLGATRVAEHLLQSITEEVAL